MRILNIHRDQAHCRKEEQNRRRRIFENEECNDNSFLESLGDIVNDHGDPVWVVGMERRPRRVRRRNVRRRYVRRRYENVERERSNDGDLIIFYWSFWTLIHITALNITALIMRKGRDNQERLQ